MSTQPNSTAPAKPRRKYRRRFRYWRRPSHTPERPRVFCASLADWLDDKAPIAWRRDLLALIAATPELDWLLLTKRPEGFLPRMRELAEMSPVAAQWLAGVPPQNVWFGVSAENQKYWENRMTYAQNIPARIHFVSAEPLLGPIVMGNLVPDWVIVGGESGRGARPMLKGWARSLRDECWQNGCAFFFKQHGGENKKLTGRELDGKTYSEFPTVKPLTA